MKIPTKLAEHILERIAAGERNCDIAKDVGCDPSQVSHLRRGYTGQNTYPWDKVKQRLLEKRDVTESGCWEWTACLCGKGYGKICVEGKQLMTHRVAYQVYNGPIPDGMVVCHSCDNMKCFNPTHLWVGTVAENNADMAKKGRGRKPLSKS